MTRVCGKVAIVALGLTVALQPWGAFAGDVDRTTSKNSEVRRNSTAAPDVQKESTAQTVVKTAGKVVVVYLCVAAAATLAVGVGGILLFRSMFKKGEKLTTPARFGNGRFGSHRNFAEPFGRRGTFGVHTEPESFF